MPLYTHYLANAEEFDTLADHIRNKSGGTEELEWPQDFIDEVDRITTGETKEYNCLYLVDKSRGVTYPDYQISAALKKITFGYESSVPGKLIVGSLLISPSEFKSSEPYIVFGRVNGGYPWTGMPKISMKINGTIVDLDDIDDISYVDTDLNLHISGVLVSKIKSNYPSQDGSVTIEFLKAYNSTTDDPGDDPTDPGGGTDDPGDDPTDPGGDPSTSS